MIDEEYKEDLMDNAWPLSELEYNLLYSSDAPEYRVILLSGADACIACILLREEDDSFLVALPAKLKTLENGSKGMASILPQELTILRIFKSSICMIMNIYEPLKGFYDIYLKEAAPGAYPDLVEELGLDCKAPENEEDLLSEVERKVDEAILNGSFIGSTSDTIH